MSDMLKAGLIRSLAAAPIARAPVSRESRSEGGFGAQLDAARDSIRDNREAARGDRAESRDEKDRAAKADAPEKPRDDGDERQGESRDATAEPGVIVAPIVVVTIAGPTVPVADASAQPGVKSPTDSKTTIAPTTITDSIDSAPESDSNTTALAPAKVAHHGNAKASDSLVPMTDTPTSPGLQPGRHSIDEQSVPATTSLGVEPNAQDDSADVTNTTWRASATPGKSTEAAPQLANPTKSIEPTQGAAVHTSSGVDHADDQANGQPEGESIRDVRIGDALERALAGGSRQPSGDAATRQGSHEQSAFGFAGPQGSARPNNVVDAGETSTSESAARPTGVSEITGDATAAAIGKFLIRVSTGADALQSSGREDSEEAGSKPAPQVVRADSEVGQAGAAPTAASGKSGNVATRAPAGATFSQILATRLDSSSSLDGTARLLAANGGTGRHQVTLRLSPAELGELRLDIRMEAGAMSLRVDADNAVAGRLIESRLGELREALSAHGISIERAEVVVRGDASANGAFEQRTHSDDATPRQHSTREESGDGSWNFHGGQSSAEGDRSGRSDANPWWARREAVDDVGPSATRGFDVGERTINTTVGNGSLDLVA